MSADSMVRPAHPGWGRGRAQQDQCSSLSSWAHCAPQHCIPPSAEHEVLAQLGQVTSPLPSFTTALQKAEKGSFEKSVSVEAARVTAGGAGLQKQPAGKRLPSPPARSCLCTGGNKHSRLLFHFKNQTKRSMAACGTAGPARVPHHIEKAWTRSITTLVPA